jgi:hypothetical protein
VTPSTRCSPNVPMSIVAKFARVGRTSTGLADQDSSRGCEPNSPHRAPGLSTEPVTGCPSTRRCVAVALGGEGKYATTTHDLSDVHQQRHEAVGVDQTAISSELRPDAGLVRVEPARPVKLDLHLADRSDVMCVCSPTRQPMYSDTKRSALKGSWMPTRLA